MGRFHTRCAWRWDTSGGLPDLAWPRRLGQRDLESHASASAIGARSTRSPVIVVHVGGQSSAAFITRVCLFHLVAERTFSCRGRSTDVRSKSALATLCKGLQRWPASGETIRIRRDDRATPCPGLCVGTALRRTHPLCAEPGHGPPSKPSRARTFPECARRGDRPGPRGAAARGRLGHVLREPACLPAHGAQGVHGVSRVGVCARGWCTGCAAVCRPTSREPECLSAEARRCCWWCCGWCRGRCCER